MGNGSLRKKQLIATSSRRTPIPRGGCGFFNLWEKNLL